MKILKQSHQLSSKLEIIQTEFKDCDDLVIREFEVGSENEVKMALVYIDGLADKVLVGNSALENLIVSSRIAQPDKIKEDIKEFVKNKTLAITEIKEIEDINEAIDNILSGETVLFIDNVKEIIVLSSRGWPTRSVSEPQTETVIRGPRDGFTETLKMNTSLVRRRIRDTKLKVKTLSLGKRSKTDTVIMYIEDIVNEKVLKRVEDRLNTIDIDSIKESGDVEQLIEDNWLSLFPQIQNTERPDVVAAALYEGRVCIMVDNTPFALIAPATLNVFLHSPEDYYERWIISTIIRTLRVIATSASLFLPALYIAVTSYHPGMLPTALTLYVAGTRMGVPFPAFTEALLMEGTLELLREAGIRLPGPIGSTIGIVGGLVIGQAAVEAGIVSPLMVIIVAITAISSFATPSYNMAIGFRILRFMFMILASILGLYGIIIGFLVVAIHLASLKSFGIPYFEPFSAMGEHTLDLKDAVFRSPLSTMKFRPRSFTNKNLVRSQDKRKEQYGEDDVDR
ncbi:spore germination protein [Alkalithermobacter thermoalcaliphilus JW-YL-7 = DSM 7308]|uniref:Spore germination protein n=1 Tax=Alkalithermobacter thermoalcaliphilus JW-YL-7 = DSM 7308 TaxID=1121328 RepID=A0A150FPD4_CLOPD|nr:GerA spore germination protein [[Clostridium] paradoxum JW-YL-7 = DSM 7308]SHL21862.1 spore germination protein [[Clostridium] paradoxum JW-YL-7 = DSM 7308]